MNPPEVASPLAVLAGVVVVVAFSGSILVWTFVALRIWQGRAVFRYEPRRHVPWTGSDVLLLASAYLVIGILVMTAFHYIFDNPHGPATAPRLASTGCAPSTPLLAAIDAHNKMNHPLIPLFGSNNKMLVALGIFFAVMKAPLIEEFIFRVILQGWLESAWIRNRRARHAMVPAETTGSIVPAVELERSANPYSSPHAQLGGIGSRVRYKGLAILSWMHKYKIARFLPVVLPALFFAMLHFRFGREPVAPTELADRFIAATVAEAIWLVAAIGLLIGVRGATTRDLGWVPKQLPYDIALGLAAVLAVVPPVLLVSGGLEHILQHYSLPISGDPAPIFLLALALGTLYQRTHRIVPSLVLHMGLNGTSVALYFLQVALAQ